MAECPQFQLMPQVMPIYRPQQPPLPAGFSMPGQPMYPIPPHFGYHPPMAWSPIHHHYPPQTQHPAYSHTEEDDDYNLQQQHAYNLSSSSSSNHNNNNINIINSNSVEDPQIELQQSQRSIKQTYTRNVSNKFDTRHEEFRKYLEEMGILSTFTNIIAEMYQDPLRPNDPLGYIRDKLNCSRPEMVELSNLRLWCDQYQTRTLRLEKELKHVIERLKKHEPYNTDDSLFNESSSDYDCKTCVTTQEHTLGNKKENANYKSIKNNNQL